MVIFTAPILSSAVEPQLYKLNVFKMFLLHAHTFLYCSAFFTGVAWCCDSQFISHSNLAYVKLLVIRDKCVSALGIFFHSMCCIN